MCSLSLWRYLQMGLQKSTKEVLPTCRCKVHTLMICCQHGPHSDCDLASWDNITIIILLIICCVSCVPYKPHSLLTHWGRVTHICVGKLTIIGSDKGLSPGRRQAIIWTNAGILLIGPLGTNFSEILIEIQTFSFKKICLKMSSVKCC